VIGERREVPRDRLCHFIKRALELPMPGTSYTSPQPKSTKGNSDEDAGGQLDFISFYRLQPC
jgi:hypothetical protein